MKKSLKDASLASLGRVCVFLCVFFPLIPFNFSKTSEMLPPSLKADIILAKYSNTYMLLRASRKHRGTDGRNDTPSYTFGFRDNDVSKCFVSLYDMLFRNEKQNMVSHFFLSHCYGAAKLSEKSKCRQIFLQLKLAMNLNRRNIPCNRAKHSIPIVSAFK